MHHSFFNYSLIKGHLDCFQFEGIMNQAKVKLSCTGFCVTVKFSLLWNKCPTVWFLCDQKFSLLWNKCPRVQLLDHYGKCVLGFIRNEWPNLSLLPTLGIITIFHLSHSDRCSVTPHSGLICIALVDNDWRRKWQPTPVFLPGESQGRGSLVGCRLWGRTELDRVGHDWSDLATAAAAVDNDVEHLFLCLFTICISSSGEMSLQVFCL